MAQAHAEARACVSSAERANDDEDAYISRSLPLWLQRCGYAKTPPWQHCIRDVATNALPHSLASSHCLSTNHGIIRVGLILQHIQRDNGEHEADEEARLICP